VIRLFSVLLRWSCLLCVPGGVLWALSPLGIYLSEYRYRTPDVFWQLFPICVLLLMAGLPGLWLRARRAGWMGRTGFVIVLAGLLLVLAGAVGKYWLGLDNVYLMTAPAYIAFRLGLLVLAAGCIMLGVAGARNGELPVWGALPFAIGSLAGLISFSRDLGSFGATLWILFGAGWAWLGLSLAVSSFVAARRKTRIK
jgi:hypothetical protein